MVNHNDVERYPGWREATAEQIHDWMVTSVSTRIPTSQASFTILGVADRLGMQAATIIHQALVANQMTGFATAYCSHPQGIDFGRDDVQQMIDSLMSGESPEAIAAVKSLGVVTQSPWQSWYGEAAEPTLEEVTRALMQAHTLEWWSSKKNLVTSALESGDISAIEDVVELLQEEA